MEVSIAGKQLTNAEVLAKLGAAKSRQDLDEAMRLYHPEMVLDIPCFDGVYKGETNLRNILTTFFKIFPDYSVSLDNQWEHNGHILVLGKISVTLTGEFEGHKANGKRVTVPVFMDFTFRDERCDYELFLFDAASVCRAAAVPTDAFVRSLARS
ncbi:nuclear transport factor 2 family protein [Paraburkholderia sp. GAS42]|uniref:nuclear transport factor 2 family protein n=1 Tax=Paraburkholderia sp. GAS42 TaxID=3035135 RepID=UPI003D253A82